MRTREATEDDLARVAELYASWQGEACTYGVCAEGVAALRKRMGPYFLVADNDDAETIGFAIGKLKNEDHCALGQKQSFLEIQDVFVRDGCRSHGFGKRLLEELLRRARENGIRQFTIYSCNRDTERIIRYYQQLGFHLCCIDMYLRDAH